MCLIFNFTKTCTVKTSVKYIVINEFANISIKIMVIDESISSKQVPRLAEILMKYWLEVEM